MKKREYMRPEIEIFGFMPEKGFATSTLDGVSYDEARDDGFEDLDDYSL